MTTTARPIPSAPRTRHAPLALGVALALVLAGCGGGGGGGGNGASAFKLRVAFTNETAADATIALDTASTPGEAQTLETCKGNVFAFDLPDGEDWTLAVNAETVIDSTQLTDVQMDKNLIAEVRANEDGTVEQLSLAPGALIGAPAALGICH